MEFLLNPNIAYVLIVASALLVLVALIVPGTGLPEVAVVFCGLLSVYEVNNLGINVWAIFVVALSIVPFLAATRARTGRAPLLAVTILLMIGGSVFLFTDAKGWPAVNPVLAGVVSLLIWGFIWIGVERTISAMHLPAANNPDKLIGKTGEARTAVQSEGSVQVGGELWSARSEKPIEAGSAVRVIGREGFVLIIQKEPR